MIHDKKILLKEAQGKMNKINLWTFNNGNTRNHGLVTIDSKGFVNGEYPVEDFGDYLLTRDRLSPSNALDRFYKLTEGKP